MQRYHILLFSLFFFLITTGGSSQISTGGNPPGFKYQTLSDDFREIRLGDIDFDSIRIEDEENDLAGYPFRYGILMPVNENMIHHVNAEKIEDKGYIWRLKLTTESALAIAVYFDRFEIPDGGVLYLYNEDKTDVLGGYTSINETSSGLFATQLIKGNAVILEYFQPFETEGLANINISEIAYAYRGIGWLFDDQERGFGDSGYCEVNINCSEGNNFQNQKNGVVKIAVKNNLTVAWCSGVLLNNTEEDYKPYILTADHCAYINGSYANPNDLKQWVFYFNYESANCMNPSNEPSAKTLVGASLISHGGNTGKTGSDFYLVILNENIPGTFNPFFSGWNWENKSSSNGAGIHHPKGDIRKVSTYDTPLVTTQWLGNGLESHWQVYWAETLNGHGVTEGGSSGSPIYDNNGLVIGTLTGGEASCTNLTGPDYYGKFSYHWQSNGSTPATHLKEWLDPDNSGIFKLGGIYYENIVAADFEADTSVIPINTLLDFTDLSIGDPNSWEWHFERAEPEYSNEQNPQDIYYNRYGSFDVTLIVKNDIMSDTIVKEDYIKVDPVISPNPSDGVFQIYLGNFDEDELKVTVFNTLGESVPVIVIKNPPVAVELDFRGIRNGMYFVRIEENGAFVTGKLMLVD